jgi:hypothetical protein
MPARFWFRDLFAGTPSTVAKHPISRVCPQCGGKEYTLRKPKQLVAFTADRVCKSCLTRYSPPTPVWGAVMLLLSTLIFGLLGFFIIHSLFNPSSFLGVACKGAFFVFTFVVFIRGIRILIDAANQGKKRT